MNDPTLIVLRALADERRTVLSRWRAHLYLRRALDPFYAEGRTNRLVVRMEKDGLLAPIPGANGQLYRVTSPYAPPQADPHETAQEAYYAGAYAYATALELHRLSDQRERALRVLVPRSPSGATTRRRSGTRGVAFVVHRAPGAESHWTLEGPRGARVAVAAVSHARREDDLADVERVRSGARGERPLPNQIVEAGEGEYRWQWARGEGGEGPLAIGADTYPDRAGAAEAERTAAAAAAKAEVQMEEAPPTETLLPPGTTLDDWRLYPLPTFVRLSEAGPYEIATHSVKPVWLFGFELREAQGGAPVRVTDLERTLIDGLRHPKLCGGLSEVFRAWVRACDGRMPPSADTLVAHAERFGQSILYQRLGFVMETLGLGHARLRAWKRDEVIRGGSRLLDADRPYAADYDEDWALSLNHPTDVLRDRDASGS